MIVVIFEACVCYASAYGEESLPEVTTPTIPSQVLNSEFYEHLEWKFSALVVQYDLLVGEFRHDFQALVEGHRNELKHSIEELRNEMKYAIDELRTDVKYSIENSLNGLATTIQSDFLQYQMFLNINTKIRNHPTRKMKLVKNSFVSEIFVNILLISFDNLLSIICNL